MSGTSQKEKDQFDTLDSPEKLTPDEYQDESTEYPIPLDTWDIWDATGTDKLRKKKRLRNTFKNKSLTYKGEAVKTPPDRRQELHKREGIKRKKQESQGGLKYYPTTKDQESFTSATADSELPKKLPEEHQVQVEKLEQETTSQKEKDQFNTLDSPEKLTPDEYQDESTEYPIPLETWDIWDATGTDRLRKKKRVHNAFMNKPLTYKGEAVKTPPDRRQELHKKEGIKRKKQEYQGGLKYYPTTKDQESFTSATADSELPKKLPEEHQVQVEKLEQETTSQKEKDQFNTLDSPEKLTPDEYQDESTEYPIPLETWDIWDATGTDRLRIKKRVHNTFKNKPLTYKGEAVKTPPDRRQELHKREGIKRKKQESQGGLKYYPTTKDQVSFTSATADSEIPKKSPEEHQVQVEKLEQETTSQKEKDQFNTLDYPEKLTPDEYQDESTEYPIPLETWDIWDATGTDRLRKKKRVHNTFKNKPLTYKGEAVKTPPDRRQELHKREGIKRKKQESQGGLKYYPTTKDQVSFTSATADSELPKKSPGEHQVQVEKLEEETTLAERKLKGCDKFSEKQFMIVGDLNSRLKNDLEERDADIETFKENLPAANATMKKDLKERVNEIKTLQEKLIEISTATKKSLSERDAEIKTLQKELEEAQNFIKANQKVLQLYRTQEMFKREMNKEKSVNN